MIMVSSQVKSRERDDERSCVGNAPSFVISLSSFSLISHPPSIPLIDLNYLYAYIFLSHASLPGPVKLL